MNLRNSLEKETVASADSEQQILDILKRCKDPLIKAKIDKGILFTSLGTELENFEHYLNEDINKDTDAVVNDFEYISGQLSYFIQQLVNRNFSSEDCLQLQESYRQLLFFSKECFAKRTFTDIIKLFEQHAIAIERNIKIALASFSGKEYQELKKYLIVYFDVEIAEDENSEVPKYLFSILVDPEETAAILDRFDNEDKDNERGLQDISYMLQLSSSLKTKTREIMKLKLYHGHLHKMLENLYSPKEKYLDDDASIHEFAFMHPSEQIKKFSQELITKLNLLVPEYVKKLFIEDLQRYEYLIDAEEKKSPNSSSRKFFTEKLIKSSLHKVELRAIEKLKQSLKGQDVEFTGLEIDALNQGPLGAIVEKYKQAGALPKDLFNRGSFTKGLTRIMASTNTKSS